MLHRGEVKETITETHQYIYAGGKLLRETISDGTTTKTLDFTYDNVGMPYSLIYNNGTTTTTYYYVTNLQGDVMYLVDASGTQVASYDYDPYGKIISATGDLAEINPLRYRGYYYDSETGFYYLQSRYYDPEICRFINADSYASTGQGFIGFNMFVYCLNNPIVGIDTDGHGFFSSLKKWVVKKILKPITMKVKKALAKKNVTYSGGYTVSGSPGVFTVGVQGTYTLDSKGNLTLQGSPFGGISITEKPSLSLTRTDSITNAPSVDRMEGKFYQVGGSFGFSAGYVPITVGGDFLILEDHDGLSDRASHYYGGSASGGLGGSPGFDFHVFWGNTYNLQSVRINIFDVLESAYDRILEE